MEQAVQTEDVLETLFECVSFEKLKELRLVCKYWNKLAAAELRKRSDTIYLDHFRHPKHLKEFYKLELSMKNQDLTAKLPICVYIQRDVKNDWKFLKDIATHEGWRTRISELKLDGFWASDLNRLLPYLLDQLPSVTVLALETVNMALNVGKSIIPRDFNIPKVSSTKRFSLTSFYADFSPVDSNDAASGTLDPRFLLQCHSLKKFLATIWDGCHEQTDFFKLLNKLHSEHVDFLATCDEIYLSVIGQNGAEHKGSLANLAQFVNNAQPASLNFGLSEPCDNLNLAYFLNLLQVELRSFTLTIPASKGPLWFSNWLMKTFKKFKIFSQLDELCLVLDTSTGIERVPEKVARDVKHNLDTVNTLKIGFDPQARFMDCEKFKYFFEDAAHHLRNVTRLELTDYLCGVGRHPDVYVWWSGFNFALIFEGIRKFSGLQEIICNVEDWTGDLQTTGMAEMGFKGLLEPLSLLAGSKVRTLTLNVVLCYDLDLLAVLLAFFKGYEPKVQLNLNLKTEGCGLKKYRYSKEEFKEKLDKIRIRTYRELLEATVSR